MGPDLELKRADTIVEALDNKDNDGALNEPDDKHVKCASNYEDILFCVNEQTRKSEDAGVDITERNMNCDTKGNRALSWDLTESSSSFGATLSETDDRENGSDIEVASHLNLDFGGSGELFRTRKKKLTSHWRSFIQPLLWRCKWVELQIKKFESQAMKYDKIIKERERRKQLKLEKFAIDLGAKSQPFDWDGQRNKVMKRKKRKRVEDLTDMAAYMSNHKLFSYYGSKRSNAGSAFFGDDWVYPAKKLDRTKDVVVSEELLSLDLRDDDNSLEQLLRKVGSIQSQVSELKTRLNKVMTENAVRMSSAEDLSLLVPCNASSLHASALSNDGEKLLVGSSSVAPRIINDCNKSDMVVPESVNSSHGEVTHISDIIESTDQPQVGSSRKSAVDGILVYTRRVKEEATDFNQTKNNGKKKVGMTKEETRMNELPTDDQRAPKMRSIAKLTAPTNKRKRSRRKPGSFQWIRKS